MSQVPENSHPVRLLAQSLQKSIGKRNVSSFEFPPSDIAVSAWYLGAFVRSGDCEDEPWSGQP